MENKPSLTVRCRDRGATLKVGGGGLTSNSEWGGGGAENTFSQNLFIIFKKVKGEGLKLP